MKFIYAFILAISSYATTAFAAETVLECQVKKVMSREFENINDFTFWEYPDLVISKVDKGYILGIGAMTYGDDETPGLGPDRILRSTKGNTQIWSSAFGDGLDEVRIEYSPKSKWAILIYIEEGQTVRPTALYLCK